MCAHGWVHALLFAMHAWMYSCYGFSLVPPPPKCIGIILSVLVYVGVGGLLVGRCMVGCVVWFCVLCSGPQCCTGSMFQSLTTVHTKHYGPTFYAYIMEPLAQKVGGRSCPCAMLFTIYTTFGLFWSQHNTQSISTSPLLVLFLFTSYVLIPPGGRGVPTCINVHLKGEK